MEMQDGIYTDLSNEDYHGSTGVSKSGLDLIARCPALYKARYIDGLKPEPTKAMAIGSATHEAVFEPAKFAKHYACAPQVDRRTKAGKAEYAAFETENAGKEVLTADDYTQVESIASAVRNHPVSASLLADNGLAETSIYATDPATGETVKVRPDWAIPDVLVDLKTTSDASPKGFAKSCANFRYHVQAALYIDFFTLAQMEYAQSANLSFVFIAVEKAEPYQVAVYVADGEFIEAGREEYRRCLSIYHECKQTGIWPGYNADKIAEISLPRWAV